MLPSSQVRQWPSALPNRLVSSHKSGNAKPHRPRVRACSIELLSQHLQSAVPRGQRLPEHFSFHRCIPFLYQQGFFPIVSGPGVLGVGVLQAYNRAGSACYDLILHSSISPHWSNASSSFFITVFYRLKAESGSSAKLTFGETCFPIALCCGRPRLGQWSLAEALCLCTTTPRTKPARSAG